MLECRYNGNCCVMYHRPFDSDDLPCDGFDEDICSLYEPMPDVKALKGLADEMEQAGKDYRYQMVENACCDNLIDDGPDDFIGYAARIREALGVEDGR